MNNLLIIYPHWPPSNLAGVHRPRLIANNISDFNWHPIVLTVAHQFYEEEFDWDFTKTIGEDIEVIYTRAIPVFKPRIIGDIGLRSLFFLYNAAKKIIQLRKIDFIWIPVPSFYTALLGPWLYNKFRIPYGIDYIDPWIRDISSRRNWRSVISLLLARWLEPIAVKKASLITGVAYEYYRPVLKRNFPYLLGDVNSLKSPYLHVSTSPRLPVNHSTGLPITHFSFPYGFDPNDYNVIPANRELPWDKNTTIPIVYAGAFLPNARITMELLFQSLEKMKKEGKIPDGIKFYFIGTGSYTGPSISELSKKSDIAEMVEEKRERLPYLTILHLLKNAHGVMVIGSTEPHYTASKLYQALLSTRPVMALLHQRSQAYEVLKEIEADTYTTVFDLPDEAIVPAIMDKLKIFFSPKDSWNPNLEDLTKYSAYESARKLVGKIEEILGSEKN